MYCHALSIVAFPVGWCAKVVVWRHPITLHIRFVALLMNSRAWSLCILTGQPFSKNILCMRHSVTVDADLSLVGHKVSSEVARSMMPNN